MERVCLRCGKSEPLGDIRDASQLLIDIADVTLCRECLLDPDTEVFMQNYEAEQKKDER